MTKGNKNVLKSSSENLHKFWDLNKNKKYQAKHNIKCYKCDADINDEIYCKDCLEGIHNND